MAAVERLPAIWLLYINLNYLSEPNNRRAGT